jgi:hypothetical protein
VLASSIPRHRTGDGEQSCITFLPFLQRFLGVRSNHAPQEVIQSIKGLPDEEFCGLQDMMKG